MVPLARRVPRPAPGSSWANARRGGRNCSNARSKCCLLLRPNAGPDYPRRISRKVLDVILSDAPRPRVENELEIDNARLRSRYFQETPLLTGAEVRAASGLNPRNKSEPASRWKREGRLFAVRRSGVDHYPAFQFADGAPRPVIRERHSRRPSEGHDRVGKSPCGSHPATAGWTATSRRNASPTRTPSSKRPAGWPIRRSGRVRPLDDDSKTPG